MSREKTGFLHMRKTKTQISFAVTAKLISAFVFATRIVQSLYFLNLKFQASSYLLWLHSPVCVGPGQKPRIPVFSERGSNYKWAVLHKNLSSGFSIRSGTNRAIFHSRWLGAFRKLRKCTIYVAKRKAQISCMVRSWSAPLFSHMQKSGFSCDAGQMSQGNRNETDTILCMRTE